MTHSVHFRPPSRRKFLHVGAVGALGLTLDGYFGCKRGPDAPPSKPRPSRCIHIFMPGGMAHQEVGTRSRPPRSNTAARCKGIVSDRRRRTLSRVHEAPPRSPTRSPSAAAMTHGEAAHERGTHNMFTGYGRARRVTRAWAAWCRTNSASATICRPTSASRASRRPTPAAAILSSVLRSVQPRGDPANNGFTVQDLSLPGGVSPQRFSTAGRCSTRSTITSPARRSRTTSTRWTRSINGPTSLLSPEGPRGVQHQAPSPTSFATSTAVTPPASACCWPAGWSRRACVRDPDLRRLGHARRQLQGARAAAAAVRPGALPR